VGTEWALGALRSWVKCARLVNGYLHGRAGRLDIDEKACSDDGDVHAKAPRSRAETALHGDLS
jgi:hypothetical protein